MIAGNYELGEKAGVAIGDGLGINQTLQYLDLKRKSAVLWAASLRSAHCALGCQISLVLGRRLGQLLQRHWAPTSRCSFFCLAVSGLLVLVVVER